jgi:hypothetical protein
MRGLHQGLLLGKHGSVGRQRAVGLSFLESTPELRLHPGNSLVSPDSFTDPVSHSDKLAMCLGVELWHRRKGIVPRV